MPAPKRRDAAPAPAPSPPPPRLWRVPALIAALAFALVLIAIDPAGSYPNAFSGPGLTIDESFNVQQGVRLYEGLKAFALGGLSLRDVYGDVEELGPNAPFGYHLPDHPPLGRLFIGVFHGLTRTIAPPHDQPGFFATAAARTAPAAAFAATVFLVGWFTTRWFGRTAGIIAAMSLVLMPRVFGHAHLASLESFIGLAYAATVLAVADAWPRDEGPSRKAAVWTGVILGLALLTKIQAVLLPIPIAVWALWNWRTRAIVPLAIFGGVAFVVFFAGWPWLWFDPIDHIREYLGRTTERVELHVWYFGQRFADRAVPWHYPWVMFLVTVPVGLQLLGVLGLFRGGTAALPASGGRQASDSDAGPRNVKIRGLTPPARQEDQAAAAPAPHAFRDPRTQLLLATMAFPLLVFSVPGTAVYDGARLFLVVFPLWGVFIGRGGAWLLSRLSQRFAPRTAAIVVGLLVAAQAYGFVAFCPVHLSYYNLLVGGLRGAERLGLEPTYWGDSVTRELIDQLVDKVPRGATVHVTPVLHQFQLPEMLAQSPILRRQGIELQSLTAGSPDELRDVRYVLTFQRKADLPAWLHAPPENARVLAGESRQGVPLATLYEFAPPAESAP